MAQPAFVRTPVGQDGKSLGIATPREGGSVPEAGHDVDMVDASSQQELHKGRHYGAYIPFASYTMPSEPTWRVKPQFVSWQIDHGRFQIQRLIGKGSYGSVAEGIDHLTGKRVAIKKITSVSFTQHLTAVPTSVETWWGANQLSSGSPSRVNW